MVSDSTFSYVHMENPSTVLFVENWEKQKLGWDDIDFPNEDEDFDIQHENLLQKFLNREEEHESDLLVMGTNTPLFNSSYANRMKQKSRNLNWKDVALDTLQIEHKNQQLEIDRTLLKNPEFSNFELSIDREIEKDVEVNFNNTLKQDILDQASLNGNTDIFSKELEAEVEDPDFITNSRNLSNPDISRTFSRQFNTPTVNNWTYLNGFQGSAQRSASQQRKPSCDYRNTSNTYSTPGHNNIR